MLHTFNNYISSLSFSMFSKKNLAPIAFKGPSVMIMSRLPISKKSWNATSNLIK